MYRSINESDEEMKAIFPRPMGVGWGGGGRMWIGSHLLIRNLARQMKNEGNKQKIKVGDGRCDNRSKINHETTSFEVFYCRQLRNGLIQR